MVSHTEVTANYSSLSCFSVNEVIGRDMSQISVSPRDRGEQAGLLRSQFPDLGRSDGSDIAHYSSGPPLMYLSVHVSLLGFWVSNSATFRMEPGVGITTLGKQHSSNSGLGKIL